jgi:hypothetical protein
MTSHFFSRLKKQTDQAPSLPVTIVSGLPRSGTSMMMKMLAAGGLSILTDESRTADESNPNGYYELERVKKLKDGDTDWLPDAEGHTVKVISALLEYLPPQYQYQVIFMRREMSEILASQKQMLAQRGESKSDISDEAMAKLFEKHLEQLQGWMVKQPNFKVLFISYNELLQNPETNIIQVNQFLGGNLDQESMIRVLDKNLYRQRKKQST